MQTAEKTLMNQVIGNYFQNFIIEIQMYLGIVDTMIDRIMLLIRQEKHVLQKMAIGIFTLGFIVFTMTDLTIEEVVIHLSSSINSIVDRVIGVI